MFAVTFNISIYRVDIQRFMTYLQEMRMTAKPKNLRYSNENSVPEKSHNHIAFSVLECLESNI